MFIQPKFNYRHSGGERMPMDVRRRKASSISPLECCFIGFRLRDADGERYHHSWILADSLDAFMYGVYLERDRILARFPGLLDSDIALVHAQSLKFLHSGISDADRAMITGEVQKMIGTQDERHFAFLGLEPVDYSIVLSDCDAVDAKAALQRGCELWATKLGRPSRVLAVFQAHPIVTEFHALFSMEAKVIESLVERTRRETVH